MRVPVARPRPSHTCFKAFTPLNARTPFLTHACFADIEIELVGQVIGGGFNIIAPGHVIENKVIKLWGAEQSIRCLIFIRFGRKQICVEDFVGRL